MTQKEFRNLFDSIRCSEQLTERMETLLSEPPAEEFAETVSGVSITQKRSRWAGAAGLAACLILITGGILLFVQQSRMPSEPPISSEQETEQQLATSSTVTEVRSTETEYVILTQTLAHTTAATGTPGPETMTETGTETTAVPPESQEIVMSDPTMPPETQLTQEPAPMQPTEPPTEPPTETTTTTAETTTTEQITAPQLEYDLTMFPISDLGGMSEDELLTMGYYYFYAADSFSKQVMTCPYQIDYMNVQERGFEENGRLWLPVTDETVTCVADVQEDFYNIYTADQSSSHIPDYYRDMEDGLYFAGKTPAVFNGMEGYYLTVESVSDTEIAYICHISIKGVVPEYPFRLVREADGWKVKKFTDPDTIDVCVVPKVD